MKPRTATTISIAFLAACALGAGQTPVLQTDAAKPGTGSDVERGQSDRYQQHHRAHKNCAGDVQRGRSGDQFTRTFPPYSLTVLQMKAG